MILLWVKYFYLCCGIIYNCLSSCNVVFDWGNYDKIINMLLFYFLENELWKW